MTYKIYHDGSNSFIKDTGTGSLVVAGSQINITNAADTEFIAKFIEDSSVELYYDNSKKFETTSTGITVTGSVDLGNGYIRKSFRLRKNQKARFGASQDLQIYHDGINLI